MGVMRSRERKSSTTPNAHRQNNMVKRLSLKSVKQEYELEPARSFIVRFAGRVERTSPGGEKIDECLKKLYKKVRDDLDGLPRVCIEISTTDVKIRWKHTAAEGQELEDIEVPFNRVSFVVADKKHQLFAFNDFVSQKPRKVDCYAFICNESEKSDVVANAFSEAFKSAHGRPGRRESSQAKDNSN